MRWMLRGLCALVALTFVCSLLPKSSPLSLWRILGDDTFVDYNDARNQKAAAGKGWGWRIKDDWRTDVVKSIPGEAHKEHHDYMYGVETSKSDSALHQTYPDIPCYLDAPAFAAHYNLTPNFSYTRRFVTAKPSPPSFKRPEGFDPVPRNLDEVLVQGWEQMEWPGWAGVGKDSCTGLTGQRQAMCLVRLGQKNPLEKDAQQQKKKEKRAEHKDVKAGLARRSAMTHISSCSSSKQPLHLPTYPVPRTRTRPHHLILGLASDVGRIFGFLPHLEYSFAWSNLHLVLNLPPDNRVEELRAALQNKGIRATIIQSPEEDYLRRWIELPSLLYDFADPGQTQWAMIGDDDTFWMSLNKILAMLDKYDPEESRYIGALTDDWRQSNSGPIAFGGAGLVLSMPLLEELRPYWTECSPAGGPADHRLAACIYAHSHTRLTLEWSLMQADLHDNIRGLLESGREIATMHHWSSWHTGFDPFLIARAGAVCGSECLLQRFLGRGATLANHTGVSAATMEDNVYLLVHGLSLTLYPSQHPDFSKTEMTWKVFGNSQFSHAIGPTRQRVREGRPHRTLGQGHAASPNWRETWTLEDVRLDNDAEGLPVAWDGDGRGAREIYIKRGSRVKGYRTGKTFSGTELAASQRKGDRLLAAEDLKEEPKAASPGGVLSSLAAKLLGKTTTVPLEDDDGPEDDSVIELVWV
ncbi:hypothetical protein BCV69DRAFT_277509 [Microstroma glucosiphilum]|uniref:Fringe-like glycosyltransferase domain-containing protein n=1 Tax=Pseudomicrostroma glucosiphilum TaxID=1684307 RepID=A0A316U4N4_9BASI|nr:hypothetical protein BCV69DRAFT_277509 [Pseudomicrostroma glucosiphilum]PWN20206.1 hypothetical protein BCV69DRAFT_277509 [Pseudomicrostroma glucosiphilum]